MIPSETPPADPQMQTVSMTDAPWMPARAEVHTDTCSSETDCIGLISYDGAMDRIEAPSSAVPSAVGSVTPRKRFGWLTITATQWVASATMGGAFTRT